MESVLNVFNERKNEIKVYIDFIELSERNEFTYDVDNKNNINKKELRRIFLANTYLLLYNLVESTIRNTIQEIYEHFNKNKVTFELLKPDIRKTILTGFKAKDPDKIVGKIKNISTDVISISFNPDKISDGNIDAKKIREIAGKYCFSDSTDFTKCKNGEKLVEIKDKRNNLSHGVLSFSECGREITITDLTSAFRETSSYLENIIENVKEYLSKKAYLVERTV